MNILCVDSSAVEINPYSERPIPQTRPATMSPTELVVKEAFSPPCQTLPVAKLPSELVVKRLSAPCKIYVCDLCEKKYRTRGGLKYHSRNCIQHLSTASDGERLQPSVADPPNFSGSCSNRATFEVSSEEATRSVCPLPNSSGDLRSPSSSVELRFFSVKPSSFVLIGYTIMLVIIFYRISSIHIYH